MIINNAGDVLDAVAEEIRARGWVQGQWEEPVSGRVCLIGALQKLNIIDTEDYIEEACKWMQQACKTTNNANVHDEWSLIGWNDYVCESQQQVIDMLQQAAKLAREIQS